MGTTRSGVVDLAATVLTLAAAFFFGFHSSRLSGSCRFWLGLLRPGRLPGVAHIRLSGRFHDRLRRGFRNWWWNGSSLDNTPRSVDVIPAYAQVHLLGRGPCPLSFRSGP